MAEYKEVMKESKRMCNSKEFCKDCVFDKDEQLCKLAAGFDEDSFLEEFEGAVMKWAKEHPRKKYPTWREWSGMIVSKLKNPQLLFPCYFVDCIKDNNCDSRCYRLDEEIPEDFAIKANIQPLEEKKTEKKGGFTFD